jgi:hypothetical protein
MTFLRLHELSKSGFNCTDIAKCDGDFLLLIVVL